MLEEYAVSFIISPLQVIYTLSNAEYQKISDKTDMGWLLKQTYQKHGILFMFRGHFVNFCYKVTSLIQPILEELLNDLFDVYDDRNFYTALASTAFTAWLLSPLETLRTRSIVQSKPSWHLSKQTILPTVLIHSLKVAVRYYSHFYITMELGFEEDIHPIMNGLSTLVSIGLESLFVAPLELVRDRLALQDNSLSEETEIDFNTTHNYVDISPKPYTGIFNCISRVVMEEGASRAINIDNFTPIEVASVYGKKSGTKFQGFLSLYRGFWMRYALSIAEHVSKEINGNAIAFDTNSFF